MILTSSNTDIAVEVLIEDDSLLIKKTGSVAIPGRFLIDIIRKVNAQTVEFALMEDRLIVIKADRSEFKLRLLDVDDYPEVDFADTQDSLLLDGQLLKTLIKETSFATATNEKRPILTGVNLKIRGSSIICCSNRLLSFKSKTL